MRAVLVGWVWLVGCGGSAPAVGPSDAPLLELKPGPGAAPLDSEQRAKQGSATAPQPAAPQPAASKPASSQLPAGTASPALGATTNVPVATQGRLVANDGMACVLHSAGNITCWSPAGTEKLAGPFARMPWLGAAITRDGRLVHPATMADYELRGVGRNGDKLPAVSHVVLGSNGGCAIKAADAALHCWGYSSMEVPRGKFTDIVSDRMESGDLYCGLRQSGEITCFSEQGSSGDASLVPRPTGRFVQLTAGCGLRDDATLACWPASAADVYTKLVPKLERIYSIQSGMVCGRTTTGESGCWGTHDKRAPFAASYDDAYFGMTRACGLLGDSVECWGRNLGGALDPPADIGKHLASRPYTLGRTSLLPDATVAPLPESKLAPSCKQIALSEAPERVQKLGQLLRSRISELMSGGLNLAKPNSSEPLYWRCADEYAFQWLYASLYEQGQRRDVTITLPSAASLAKFDRKYEAVSRAGKREPRDSDTGNIEYARKWRGHRAHMSWTRVSRGKGDPRDRAVLVAEVEGLLFREVNTDVGMRMEGDFDAYRQEVEALSTALTRAERAAEEALGERDPQLTGLVRKYPRDLLTARPALEKQLDSVLGKQQSAFWQRLTVQSPLELYGDYLLAEGCQQRVCLGEAAVFVVNVRSGQVHAGIVSGSAPSGSKVFGPPGVPAPRVLQQWMAARRAAISEAVGGH